jgi:adenylosuccinate lyase
MQLTPLNALCPLDGRYASSTQGLRHIFSEFGLFKYRVQVEIQWIIALSNEPKITEVPKLSVDALHTLQAINEKFSFEDAQAIKDIEATTRHDVKAVEYFIKEHVAGNQELAKVSEFIHFGCTSEDINNLAYALMLHTARKQSLLPLLNEILSTLKSMAHEYAEHPMLARTHGQPATPTTIGKEIANTIARLKRQTEQLITTPILGKFNGASGNYNAYSVAYPDTDWQQLSKNFISQLGLTWNPYTTQIEPHDYIAEFCMTLSRINTILIDFNRDMWGYIALNYFTQKTFNHEVGSSAMPHKVNPIDFENAEGNLGIANALFEHMAAKLPISRWQRDLSDSTVLRNMGVAIAHTVLAYQSTCKALQRITPHSEIILADLDRHWEILAEPIQTMMRRFGIDQPYEKLKSFTRGKKIDKALLHQFIAELELPADIKQQLYELTPHHYLGYACDLAKRI